MSLPLGLHVHIIDKRRSQDGMEALTIPADKGYQERQQLITDVRKEQHKSFLEEQRF